MKTKSEVLKRRIEKMKDWMKRPEVSPDLEIYQNILSILEEKLEVLIQNPDIQIPEVTSLAIPEDEDDLINKLGPIYWIFGQSFEKNFSFKTYRIDFLRLLPNSEEASRYGLILDIQVAIYEDNSPLVTEYAAISFWKGWTNSGKIGDLSISFNQPSKYNSLHWFDCISYYIAKTWNEYFGNDSIPCHFGENTNQKKFHLKPHDVFSPYEPRKHANIPKEAVEVINHHNLSSQDMLQLEPLLTELAVDVPIFAFNAKNATLMYALEEGTAYQIVNDDIYIWYMPPKGIEGAGFFKLKRFFFQNNMSYIKYIVDSRYPLEEI